MNKYLILGSAGQLGKAFQEKMNKKKMTFWAPPETQSNITDPTSIETLVKDYSPDCIINCAAYNAVDQAEKDQETAFLVNYQAVEQLSRICKDNNIFLVHYSSDYVFDGLKFDYYLENDATNPLNVYGLSKLKGENSVRSVLSDYLVFRLSWVIGKGKQNFIYKLNNWAQQNQKLKISCDETSVPTFTDDIVELTLKSINIGLTGLYHLVNSGYASRYELAKQFLKLTKQDNIVIPVPIDTFETTAKRPKFSPMSNQKLANDLNVSIPSWEESLNNYISENFY